MEPANVGLEKVLSKSMRKIRPEEAPVLAWPLACGNRVSNRTRALDYANGILRVQVPDPGWRSELQCIAAQYLVILNRYVGGAVRRIEFVVADCKPGR